MSKELRRSLKEWLAGLTKLQTELERLNTPENQEILNQYPIIDKDWRHPQSHLYERTLYFVEQTRKAMVKIVEALPRERKSKNDKKVVFKDINNEKRAKPPSTKKRGRKPKAVEGSNRDGDLGTKAETGLAPVPQERRKRGRPKSNPKE